MNIQQIISEELHKTFPDVVFFFDKYDSFWQCSWTDGPLTKQITHFFSMIFPVYKLIPTYESIMITEGFEYFSKHEVLYIRLIRYISPEREHKIRNYIAKSGLIQTPAIPTDLTQYEEYLIRNCIISGYQMNTAGFYYLSSVDDGNLPTMLSAIELTRRHNRFKDYDSKDRLMLSVLLKIYGENRLNELIDDGEDTIEEMFEATAYVIYSDRKTK